MSEHDGGPAFPQTWEADSGDQPTGMSLRDYFAAHAPTEYASWYAPVLPPRPTPDFSDHDHGNEPRCHREWDCMALNRAELDAYDDERRRQTELQWPYAYADAMLKERIK